MSKKTYIANKADKFGVTGKVWASFYVNKDSYKDLVLEVEAGGLEKAAEIYKVDKSRVIKWLRFNGRGKFIKQDSAKQDQSVKNENVQVEMAA